MINWNEVSPKDIKLDDLEKAQEDDFPQTYSGQAWWAAWIMYHKEYKANPEEFLEKDGWSEFPELSKELKRRDTDLTGFMVGWACNALRYILDKGPVADGATLIIGSKDKPKGIYIANAERSVKVAIGGKKALEDE